MSDEWLDFIGDCRSGKIHTLSSLDSLTFVKSVAVYNQNTHAGTENCIHEKF